MGVVRLEEEPIKFYRRFVAHFSSHGDKGEYVPTMACCDMNNNSLKVRTLVHAPHELPPYNLFIINS